jgi:hypothetical protein
MENYTFVSNQGICRLDLSFYARRILIVRDVMNKRSSLSFCHNKVIPGRKLSRTSHNEESILHEIAKGLKFVSRS